MINITWKGSPNFTIGRSGQLPIAIVVHIMEGSLAGTDDWFSKPISQVSAHYGIGKNGDVHQYVQEADTAWHGGAVLNPSWKLIKPGVNPNSYTIGIEHEGKSTDVWTDKMKASSVELIKDICSRYHIPIDRSHIIGHYEITTNKVNCPAQDHTIIDTLVAMANAGNAGPVSGNADINKAVSCLQTAIDLIKKYG